MGINISLTLKQQPKYVAWELLFKHHQTDIFGKKYVDHRTWQELGAGVGPYHASLRTGRLAAASVAVGRPGWRTQGRGTMGTPGRGSGDMPPPPHAMQEPHRSPRPPPSFGTAREKTRPSNHLRARRPPEVQEATRPPPSRDLIPGNYRSR